MKRGMMRTLFCLCAVGMMFWVRPAWADLAPPNDYVEQCTLEKQQTNAGDCELCNNSHMDGGTACEGQWSSKGYKMRCKTRGASVWQEIWCKADSKAPANTTSDAGNQPAPDSKTNNDPPKMGCSALPQEGSAYLAAFAFLFFFFGTSAFRIYQKRRD